LETWEKYTEGSMQVIRVELDKGNGVEAEWVDAIELGKAMLTGYLEKYGKDEQWDFIATERSGSIRIPDRSGSPIVRYAYTFDGVFRNVESGGFRLLETKTAAAIVTGHLPMDTQAGSYWAIASWELRKLGLLGPKERIEGITYNFLRKAMPDERPKHPVSGESCNLPTKDHFLTALADAGAKEAILESDPNSTVPLAKAKVVDLKATAEMMGLVVVGDPSKNQPKPLFHREFVRRTAKERNRQLRRIADETEWMNAVRDGNLPITKTNRSNGVDACHYGCEFYDMCGLHESGGDWELVRDMMFTVQDPYADHRKSAHMEV